MQGINEAMISFYLYELIMISDFNPDKEDFKSSIGWALLSTIFFNIAASLIKTCYSIFLNCKRLQRKRSYLKKLREREEARKAATEQTMAEVEEENKSDHIQAVIRKASKPRPWKSRAFVPQIYFGHIEG